MRSGVWGTILVPARAEDQDYLNNLFNQYKDKHFLVVGANERTKELHDFFWALMRVVSKYCHHKFSTPELAKMALMFVIGETYDGKKFNEKGEVVGTFEAPKSIAFDNMTQDRFIEIVTKAKYHFLPIAQEGLSLEVLDEMNDEIAAISGEVIDFSKLEPLEKK